jgi:hypothetical protein
LRRLPRLLRLDLGGRVPGGSDDGGFDEFCEFLPIRAFSSTISTRAAASSARVSASSCWSALTSASSSSYVGGAEISPVRSSRCESQESA